MSEKRGGLVDPKRMPYPLGDDGPERFIANFNYTIGDNAPFAGIVPTHLMISIAEYDALKTEVQRLRTELEQLRREGEA